MSLASCLWRIALLSLFTLSTLSLRQRRVTDVRLDKVWNFDYGLWVKRPICVSPKLSVGAPSSAAASASASASLSRGCLKNSAAPVHVEKLNRLLSHSWSLFPRSRSLWKPLRLHHECWGFLKMMLVIVEKVFIWRLILKEPFAPEFLGGFYLSIMMMVVESVGKV